jgi:cytidine deaminase
MSKHTPENLIAQAKEAREKAYAPYSKYKVGAAVVTTTGQITQGANVENCSYGLTLCAERNALTHSVFQGLLPGCLDAVAVVVEGSEEASPCGACRQTIAEFAHAETLVHIHNITTQKTVTYKASDLLPHAFTPMHLSHRP